VVLGIEQDATYVTLARERLAFHTGAV